MTIKLNDHQRKALNVRLLDVLMDRPWIFDDMGKQPYDEMRRYIVRRKPPLMPITGATIPDDMEPMHVFRQNERLEALICYNEKLTEALIAAIEAT